MSDPAPISSSLLCAWLRSLGGQREPDPLGPWACYQLRGKPISVPMLDNAPDWRRWAVDCVHDAARVMGWSAERAWADLHYGPWRDAGMQLRTGATSAAPVRDTSRSLLGGAESLGMICSGSYEPTDSAEPEQLAAFIRGRLAAWVPTQLEHRQELDDAARAYAAAALRLWETHGAPGMRPCKP